jgi:hypothetical protein
LSRQPARLALGSFRRSKETPLLLLIGETNFSGVLKRMTTTRRSMPGLLHPDWKCREGAGDFIPYGGREHIRKST